MPAGHTPSVFPLLVSAALLMAQTAAPPQAAPGVRLRSIPGDLATGVSRAVVVEEGALVHTALMFPEDREGRLVGGVDATAQGARVLANIELALKAARTTLEHLVRLHVYVADSSVTPRIDRLLADRFGGRKAQPAVTFVETAIETVGLTFDQVVQIKSFFGDMRHAQRLEEIDLVSLEIPVARPARAPPTEAPPRATTA